MGNASGDATPATCGVCPPGALRHGRWGSRCSHSASDVPPAKPNIADDPARHRTIAGIDAVQRDLPLVLLIEQHRVAPRERAFGHAQFELRLDAVHLDALDRPAFELRDPIQRERDRHCKQASGQCEARMSHHSSPRIAWIMPNT
ncbi:hypothetical protein WS70_27105 [Burkholderia mayonis]|uniref:Uncharacterized protein n=1 Tax=Burkholderia mayonis TaxID=1385591 RepID=A0A1B4FNW7_9BURK|nr:hypothetical protein WS70_27105 [Burkholderia mayonis]KVE37393.1 hypothetical protein WS69_10980 [Burkholderia sp. BDU5]KVE47924.1 hypothetical protein WS70_25655 [Burkholderia mayonis]